jgi:hypothetical protein
MTRGGTGGIDSERIGKAIFHREDEDDGGRKLGSPGQPIVRPRRCPVYWA